MFTRLRDYRIIPSIDSLSVDEAVHVADALVEAGLPVLEILYRNHSDAQVVRAILERHPDFIIGVGGVLNADLVLRAADAKVRFMTSPGYNAEILEEAKKHSNYFAGGVCTPSDVMATISAGITNLNFFPAQYFGGAAMLSELLGPFSHLNIHVVAKGGITVDNMHEYLRLSSISAIVCPWIVNEEAVQYKQWGIIKQLAIKARALSTEKQTVYFSK